MKHHDVITLLKLGDSVYSSKIGSFIHTKKEHCYKLLLDYRPDDSESPLLIVQKYDANDDGIFRHDWMFHENIKSHSVYGYTQYGQPNTDGKRKHAKQRIGTIFLTKTENIYQLKINLWPTNPNTDILCFEVDADEAFDMESKLSQQR